MQYYVSALLLGTWEPENSGEQSAGRCSVRLRSRLSSSKQQNATKICASDNDLGKPKARSPPRRACCMGTLAETAEVKLSPLWSQRSVIGGFAQDMVWPSTGVNISSLKSLLIPERVRRPPGACEALGLSPLVQAGHTPPVSKVFHSYPHVQTHLSSLLGRPTTEWAADKLQKQVARAANNSRRFHSQARSQL